MTGARTPLTALLRAPGAARKQVRRLLAARYYRYYFSRHADHPALDERQAADAVGDAGRVLFCCWGNICRSPMAERYLRGVLDGTDHGITVRSAGLGEREGRPSPPTAVDAAARYGVDLSDHRSVRTTDRLVAECDVVFVMDFHNYHLLRARHGPVGNVFFLSTFADGGRQIPDPAGKSPDTFDRVYETIVEAAEAIAAVVRGTGTGTETGTGTGTPGLSAE